MDQAVGGPRCGEFSKNFYFPSKNIKKNSSRKLIHHVSPCRRRKVKKVSTERIPKLLSTFQPTIKVQTERLGTEKKNLVASDVERIC